MTTGSLKLLSLLVVIAAGGGVAWQVQQGLLHPEKASVEVTSDDDSSPVSEDDASISFSNSTDEVDERPPTIQRTVANTDSQIDDPDVWDRKPERTNSPRGRETVPAKFQRSPPSGPSLGAAIPARVAVTDIAEEQEDSTAEVSTAEDSAREQVKPASKKNPQKRLTFAAAQAALEETVSDEDDSPAAASVTDADHAANDPFEDSSPVLLVGSDESEPENTPALASEEADDPFAGSAPPDLDEPRTVDEDQPALPDLKSQTDESTAEPALTPSQRDRLENTPRRSGGRNSARSREERIPARHQHESTDDLFDQDLPPTLGDAASPPTKKSPRSSPRSSKSTEEPTADPTAEPTPRLLPVPDGPPSKASPKRSEDVETKSSDEPDLGGFGPSDTLLNEDELRGDATPDRGAPQGLQQPRLTIEKIAPKQATVGQPLVYSVVVKNIGSAEAHQVTVEDRIPKGTKLEGTSPRAELIEKKLVWRLGTLKPDEQKKISIKLIPQEQGPIGSVAKVNFVAEIATEIEVTAPQILMSIDAPSQVRLGDKLHLVFKIRNAGGADAQNVVVRNLIPDGLRHPAGADLEFAMGTLASQESREIKLDLIATKNGKVANQTIITADGGISVEEDTAVEVIGEQLLLTRTGKNRLFVDKPAVFTSTVANEGTASATKVTVAEVVPAELEFVSASDNGKYDPVTRAVTWSVGPIGPGEELKLSTKLLPKHLGDCRATVTVTGPAGSVATVDAELKVDGFPAVAVESKTNARLISVGEKATIRIHCKNQGTAGAKNLILSAELPPELKLVDGNGPSAWARQGNVITFEAIPHLNPNDTATFDVQVEGVTEGDTRVELRISADHLTRPLHRDETIRISPEAE